MTGFDSEADRRDAVRRQVVAKCMEQIYETIRSGSVTHTIEERAYLTVAVADELIDAIRMEARSMMMRQEIHAAEAMIDKI